MADAAWKGFERQAANLFGGRRHWANSGERLDFETPGAIGQCKLVKRLSLEALSRLAEEMEREALPRLKAGVVVVKVRRGRGRPYPLLVVCTEAVWRHLNGPAEGEP